MDPKNYFQDMMPILKRKNGVEAWALFTLLFFSKRLTWDKITKKECNELMGSPTKTKKAIECLEYYWILDLATWERWAPKFTLPDEIPIRDAEKDMAWLIAKLIPTDFNRTVSYLSTTIKDIGLASAAWRYTPEDFLPLLIWVIKKDEWWKDKISWETFARKFPTLWEKFKSSVPKRSWELSELSNVF